MARMRRRSEGPVRLAIIGLGRSGWDIHAAALRGRKDFVITDVVDLKEDRLEEARREFGCRTHTSLRGFLRENDAEIAVVATLSCDHARMSIEALRSGLHVLVEKPMATRWRDVDRMIAAAKENRRLLTVHQNMRLYPDFVHIQQVIRSGVLGRIFSIKRAEVSFARRNDWQVLRKYGGGLLNNWGVHLVDQVLQIMDSPPRDVFADVQHVLNPGDADDHNTILIRAESGQAALIELSNACAQPLPQWVLMGTKGTLVADRENFHLKYYRKALPRVAPIDSTAVEGRRYGFGEQIPWEEETVKAAVPVEKNFYDYLYASLREGEPLFVTAESARQTMWVLHQARKGTEFRE